MRHFRSSADGRWRTVVLLLVATLGLGPFFASQALARSGRGYRGAQSHHAYRSAGSTVYVRGLGRVSRRALPGIAKAIAPGLLNSDLLLSSVSPRSELRLKRITRTRTATLSDGFFVVDQARRIAQALAASAKTRAEMSLWTVGQVILTALLARDRLLAAQIWVSRWTCGSVSEGCLSLAHDLLDMSTILREQAAKEGFDSVAAWINQSDDEGRDYRAAWIAVAEFHFILSLDLDFDEGVSSLDISDLLLAAAAAGKMKPDLAAAAANQWKSVNLAPSPCASQTAGQGGQFGACGLPGAGGDAGPGDPSPLEFASFGSVPNGGGGFDPFDPSITQEAPDWAMPGACYGVDPSKLFDYAGGDSADDDGADNTDSGNTDEAAEAKANYEQMKKQMEEMKKQMEEMKKQVEEIKGEIEAQEKEDATDGVIEDVVDSLPLPDFIKVPLKRGIKLGVHKNALPNLANIVKQDPKFWLHKLMPSPEAPVSLEDGCGQSALSGLLGCMFGGAFGGGEAQTVCSHSMAPVTPTGPGVTLCGCFEGGTVCSYGSAGTSDTIGSSGAPDAWGSSTVDAGPMCYQGGGDDGCPPSCQMSKVAGDFGPGGALPDACAVCEGGSAEAQSIFDICALAQLSGVQAPAWCFQVGPGAGGDPY